jgi:GcrA cell cycle regulator
LYRDGLSFALIAAEIGVSRNAAIGKAHRMCLPKRIELIKSNRRVKSSNPPPKRRRDRTKVVGPPPIPKPVVIPGHDYRCSILELSDVTCRYPCWEVGTPAKDRLYCGCPGASLSGNVPYCERHALLCNPTK